jgi:MFS family permease
VSDHFWMLLLGRALIGLGVASAMTAGLKALVLWFPGDRVPLLNGLMVMLGALGAVTATLPADLLLDWIGWRELSRARPRGNGRRPGWIGVVAARAQIGAGALTFRIEKLRRDHRVEGFDCGKEPLNRFLIRFALQSQLSNSSQTYLAFSQDEVVGFYTLAFGDVNYEDAPERLRKGVARHPIPLMILARLAVARAWAGKRIGSGLLKDALARTLAAAEIAGLRAFAVHAKDDEARAFYERFDFIASPSDPMHLFVLLKDVRALIGP